MTKGGFNSKMVRLKVFFSLHISSHMRCFNSKMVRLKEKSRRNSNRTNNKFQFQNGTIKSGFSIPATGTLLLFQFQNGTIKSVPVKLATRIEVLRFNSKMVRLKVHSLIIPKTIFICFNSKMVRLKEKCKKLRKEKNFVSIPKWYD